MIGKIFFEENATVHPAYVLDCLGNLVRCSSKGDSKSLIPFAVELVSKASELKAPYPWTITVEKLLSRINFVAEARPTIISAYPGYNIPMMTLPFVPHRSLIEDEDLVFEAIKAFPSLPPEQRSVLQGKLEENGVFQIPLVGAFARSLHEASGDGICVAPISYVTAGWMSSMKIYQKALVRSA